MFTDIKLTIQYILKCLDGNYQSLHNIMKDVLNSNEFINSDHIKAMNIFDQLDN